MELLLLPLFLLLGSSAVSAGRKAASLSKAVVTLHPPWFSILTKDLVTLRCEGSGTPGYNSTLWFHNGLIIPVQSQDYNIRADTTNYSGEYQCQTNQAALSDPVRLEVFKDWLLLQTLKLFYMEGEPMMLKCHSWGNKHISKVTFYQNGEGRKFFLHNSNFSISHVNQDDSGDYFCSAAIGNRRQNSTVVRITVQGSNAFTIWYHITFYFVMGILFSLDTGLYFTLKRETNNLNKNTRSPVTKWHKELEDK